jgi:hypothetical protein
MIVGNLTYGDFQHQPNVHNTKNCTRFCSRTGLKIKRETLTEHENKIYNPSRASGASASPAAIGMGQTPYRRSIVRPPALISTASGFHYGIVRLCMMSKPKQLLDVSHDKLPRTSGRTGVKHYHDDIWYAPRIAVCRHQHSAMLHVLTTRSNRRCHYMRAITI